MATAARTMQAYRNFINGHRVESRCGGTKGAGISLREMGSVAVDFYTELKSVHIDYSTRKH